MSRLIPMQFNNYFNRIVKRYDTITEYIDNAIEPESVGVSMFLLDNEGKPAIINFKPNDDVKTNQIANWDKDWTPDYLLVVSNTTTDIESRWFVTESVRLRNGQYRFFLKRDLIADNYEAFQNSVALIEKGKPLSVEDVSIYNREDFNGNEIKIRESILKDESTTAWIVGYYTNTGDVSVTIPISPFDLSLSDLEDWDFYDYIDNVKKEINDFTIQVTADYISNPSSYIVFSNKGRIGTSNNPDFYLHNARIKASEIDNAINCLEENKTDIINEFCILHSGYDTNNINTDSIDGLIIYVSGENKYYRISVEVSFEDFRINNTKNDSVDTLINNTLKNELGTADYEYPIALSLTGSNTVCYGSTKNILIKKTDITSQMKQMSVTIPATSNKLKDAPYKMFAIPFDKISVRELNQGTGSPNVSFDSLISDLTLQIPSLLQANASITLYDIQLLPYCPMPEQIIRYGTNITNLGVFYGNLNPDYDYSFIKDSGNNNTGIIFYPLSSSFYTLARNYFTDTQVSDDIETFKVSNQFNKMRIVSPNYASSFEMKNTYNGTFVNFSISCTYKPYSPYVNVRPSKIDKLYGRDYKDGFGLILQGDFSICLMNDEWKQYQLNNKNYLNAFNRGIESLDLRQEYEKLQNIVGGIAGTASGTAQGLLASGGNPVGAIAGGGASAIAGAVDIAYGERLRADQKDLAIDNFYYNIANVKARPQTIAKVSAYDINNKIYPFLELYTCTDWEKETFKRKLKYNGYTINRIAKIKDYYDNSTFIKGMIIKCEMLNDTHVLNALYEEFAKGVYANEPTI